MIPKIRKYPGQFLFIVAVTVLATDGHPSQNKPAPNGPKPLNGRKVVLMSMDGFRYDYLNKTDTPSFDAMIASGVKVPYVNNTFATLTFPCHYSIATGRYEESHGIIDNSMYDPVLNESFRMGNIQTRWWDGAEPIWVNAVKSGRRVGTFFWPGSESTMSGHSPSEWRSQPYDGNVPFEERIDTLIHDWLLGDDVDLGIIYFDEPDHTGHKYGPEAPEMPRIIRRMDSLLGYFMHKLEDEGLKDKVDFILTSDHGMTAIDQTNRLIAIRDYVNDTLLKQVVSQGALAHLIPQEGKTEQLVAALSGIEHLSVYTKDDIPDHYHYKHHRRVMPVVAVADLGWEIRETHRKFMKGNHGYSNLYMEMKPLLVATGPSFKAGAEGDVIQNVDIYPLLCHLLDIPPAPHNGSLERAHPLLRDAQNDAGNSASTTRDENKATSVSTFSCLTTFLVALFLSFSV